MRLDKITLENFRQYYGRQRLTFAGAGERNVTVINGVNGAGKTSFFLALNWCLYGRRVADVDVIKNVGELVSKEALSRAEPGERVPAAVELTFFHDGTRYAARRAVYASTEPDGTVTTGDEEFTLMATQPDGKAERVENPESVVNVMLPATARTYFFFDGEKIDDFARPEASDEVKEAVYLVLNLEQLERAQYHLSECAREYRSELRRMSSGELADLLEKDERLRETRDKHRAAVEEARKEVRSAQGHIKDVEELLLHSSAAKALQEKRADLEGQSFREQKRRDAQTERVQSALMRAPGAYAASAVSRALAVLDEKRAKGEIPSAIRAQFVQDLLDAGVCLCGRSLESGAAETLAALMRKGYSDRLESEVIEATAQIRQLQVAAPLAIGDLAHAADERVQAVRMIDSLDAQLSEVKHQLAGSTESDVARLEEKRDEYVDDVEHHTLRIGELTGAIQTIDADLKGLEAEINAAQKAEKRHALLSAKMELAQHSADAIEAMKTLFADEMRGQIEEKTREVFGKLVWKQSQFTGVELDADFNLEVIDRYGMPARPELSAGERQVLSLSFITAMARISGEEAPLVMDTPFGRLSGKPRLAIAENLPALTDQLVLFVTDEELRDDARRVLSGRIGKEYDLHFDEATSTTTVVPTP